MTSNYKRILKKENSIFNMCYFTYLEFTYWVTQYCLRIRVRWLWRQFYDLSWQRVLKRSVGKGHIEIGKGSDGSLLVTRLKKNGVYFILCHTSVSKHTLEKLGCIIQTLGRYNILSHELRKNNDSSKETYLYCLK